MAFNIYTISANIIHMVNFTCPKCGAPLPVKPGTQLSVCSYCGTPSYIDRREAIFFYILPFSITEDAARAIFKRWTAGPSCPKDMEATAEITNLKKEYFPVFRFRRTVDGKEKIAARPARGTLLPGVHSIEIPPGDMVIFDSNAKAGGAEVLHPDIAIDSYVGELEGTPIDQSLVYFPIYELKYRYNGTEYAMVIDGSSGRISVTNSPKRSSVSYVAVMALAFVLGFIGTLLGFIITPIFFVLVIAGIFAGKILAHKVVKKPDGGAA